MSVCPAALRLYCDHLLRLWRILKSRGPITKLLYEQQQKIAEIDVFNIGYLQGVGRTPAANLEVNRICTNTSLEGFALVVRKRPIYQISISELFRYISGKNKIGST
jgi:hypothetical protein